MAIIKCKMCGGDIEISADKTFGTCEYCGSTMTLPKVDDEQRAAAFNRGNHFRRSGEFDKALAVYERIVAEDDNDAEAHWCCALCRFGIEYVEDPATYEWLPTCHRASFDSFLEDVDYLAAVEHSDGITRRQYQKDAAKIAEVQRGILATSQNEQPFDVFLCYKETGEDGQRTRDSLMAQEVYYELTEQGYRVFFARITLEDKAGAEYEPYIFAALNSAKVMVVIGSKPEHFNAVWVKNEWSRFLSMMKKDRSKLLLPCYRDMDPYDLPEALSVLQSYDMSKIGFMQDLIRGVKKVIDAGKPQEAAKETVKETVVVHNEGGSNVQALLKRGNMALEDGEWSKADEFFEQVLNQDAECGAAYLGKFLASRKRRTLDDLVSDITLYHKESEIGYSTDNYKVNDGTKNYEKAMRFGDDQLKANLTQAIRLGKQQRVDDDCQMVYDAAVKQRNSANTSDEYECVAELFSTICNFKDAAEQMLACRNKAKEIIQRSLDEIAAAKRTVIHRREDMLAQFGICNAENEQLKARAVQLSNEAAKITGFFRRNERLVIRNEYVAVQREREKLLQKCYQLYSNYARELATASYHEIIDIAVGERHSVGLTAGGHVVSAGDNRDGQCNTAEWTEIQGVSAGNCTLGITTEGRVVATGDNAFGQSSVSYWKGIVAAATGSTHSVGVGKSGIVFATGSNMNGKIALQEWEHICGVAVGKEHSIGLLQNATVVARGSNEQGQCNVDSWNDVVMVAAGDYHTVGLKIDGSVVATGDNSSEQCNVDEWRDIIAISAGAAHTIGLKADGTVLAVGDNSDGQCDVLEWTDIIGIAAGGKTTLALRFDGTLVAVGNNDYGQCDVSDWTDIKLPD